eukprot:gene1565-4713_t
MAFKSGKRFVVRGPKEDFVGWLTIAAEDNPSVLMIPVNAGGDTLLHLAARHAQPESLRAMLQSDYQFSINKRNKCGHTVLHEAVLAECTSSVAQLLDASADVSIAKHADWTPLHLAATKPNANVVDLLLSAGADPRRVNKDGTCASIATILIGWTPLHIACRSGCLAVVHSLLKTAPDANQIASTTKRTPLMTAATHGHTEIVDTLLDAFPEAVNAHDSCGWNALFWAIAGGAISTVHCLIRRGSDVFHQDLEHRTVLHIAAISGDGGEHFNASPEDAVTVLKIVHEELPSALSQPDLHGLTPLHHAAMHGHGKHVHYFLKYGASAASKDKFGRTPKLLCESHKHFSILNLFPDS